MIKYVAIQYFILAAIFSIGVAPARSLTLRQKAFYIGFWPALCWRALKVIFYEWRTALSADGNRKAGK